MTMRRVAAALLLAAAGPLAAQGMPAALQACARIGDNAARLACFDREVPRLPADAAVSTPAPVVRLTPQEKLGLTHEQVETRESGHKPATPKSLQAHIASVSARGGGSGVFVLDNGQVWQQTESRSSFFVRPGDAVTISGGALGSFWIATDAHNATRVKRVQ